MSKVKGISGQVKRFVKNDSGGTLAELALTIPFVAIMLAGVAEFGRYFQTYTTLAKSTRTAARYLSNHPFNNAEKARAKNLVVCGKLVCAGGDELAPGLSAANVCIDSTGSPQPVTVTVSIPGSGNPCGSTFTYQPVFDLGALLNNHYLSLQLPINSSTTMYYMLDN